MSEIWRKRERENEIIFYLLELILLQSKIRICNKIFMTSFGCFEQFASVTIFVFFVMF
jgi:hypothetical protein